MILTMFHFLNQQCFFMSVSVSCSTLHTSGEAFQQIGQFPIPLLSVISQQILVIAPVYI